MFDTASIGFQAEPQRMNELLQQSVDGANPELGLVLEHLPRVFAP